MRLSLAVLSYIILKPVARKYLPPLTPFNLTMASASFFAGATNVTIVGGEFNDIKGNLTVFDQSRHHTNLGSNNWSKHEIIDSYNDNSTTIGEQFNLFRLKVV
jgi:hypothetical protein